MSSSTNAPKPATKPPVVLPGTGNNIIVNPLQRGNPILECVRNVGKEFAEIVADYQVGRTTGVLFLSLKYHRLHPEYIHTRIEKLGHSYTLRILLVLCDISEHRDPVRELTKICLINNITVIVAFSLEDAGHYLTTFKQFEHKPPDLIKERVDKDYNAILRSALTSVSRVNKTDVETLRTSFGNLSNIASATSDQLQNLPGFGHVKVKNLKNAFEKPIRNNTTASLSFNASQSFVSLRVKPGSVATKRDALTPGTSSPEASQQLSSENGPSHPEVGRTEPSEARPTPEQQPRSPYSLFQPLNVPDTTRYSPDWDIELDLN